MADTVSNLLLSIAPGKMLYYPIEDSKREASYKEKLAVATSSTTAPIAYPWQSEVEDGSIAIHPIQGLLTNKSCWRFSYQEFIEDLRSAESNENFAAHLLIIDSPGGHVFGAHEAHEAIRNCSKPVYVLIESICASAAYWLASAADKIFASSPISEVGSVGVMATLTDDTEAWQKYGYKIINLYASDSHRKNKVINDAIAGKTKEYIEKMLDPILEIMIGDVCSSRNIPSESEARNGEIYYCQDAAAHGLIDGILSIEDTISLISQTIKPIIDINHINLY